MSEAFHALITEGVLEDYNLQGPPQKKRPDPKARLSLLLFTQHMTEVARRCSQGEVPNAKHWNYIGQQIRSLARRVKRRYFLAYSDIAVLLYQHWIYHGRDIALRCESKGILAEMMQEADSGNSDRLMRKLSVQANLLNTRTTTGLYLFHQDLRAVFETDEKLATQYNLAFRSYASLPGDAPAPVGALAVGASENWKPGECYGTHAPNDVFVFNVGFHVVAMVTMAAAFLWLVWYLLSSRTA